MRALFEKWLTGARPRPRIGDMTATHVQPSQFTIKHGSTSSVACCEQTEGSARISTLGWLAKSTVTAVTALAILAAPTLSAQGTGAEEGSSAESPIKFALFSAAWGENTDDGLRLVAQNLTQQAITLEKISFIDLPSENDQTELNLSLRLRAERYAETNLPLVDLLTGDDCVARTMAEGWKLVEISNYTLNPSVRNLIIENTNSFRIYQCVRSARLTWRSAGERADASEGAQKASTEFDGWVLYHFESLSN